MRGRERADGGRGDGVNGVNRSQWKFLTGTAVGFRGDRNHLSGSRITQEPGRSLQADSTCVSASHMFHKTLHLIKGNIVRLHRNSDTLLKKHLQEPTNRFVSEAEASTPVKVNC